MSSMQEIMDANPDWEKYYKYAMGPPNSGHYKRWIQGSVGMMDGLPLYSNEYSHLYMKHGQNNLLPYRGNVKQFAPSVNPKMMHDCQMCSNQTLNPVGCQDSAIRQAYTVDNTTLYTPHPYNASYKNGLIMGMPVIPPNSPYQD